MFRVGDLVQYESTGVCRVTDIKEQEPGGKGEKQLFYVLSPLYQNCTILTPVNSTKVFMRPIISRDEAEKLIDRIPDIRAEAYHNRVLNQLAEHYKASLNTHDCADLLKLSMSIYAKKQFAEQQKRKLGAVDEKFMRRAEDLLFGELAAALNITKAEVPEYIEERVNRKRKDSGQ
jgi:CarD family transcriptional regulator